MRHMRVIALAGIALAATASAATWLLSGGRQTHGGRGDTLAVATSTARVVRTDVAERRPVVGTLVHAGTYDVVASGSGTLTWLPVDGHVVRRGDAAFEVDGTRVPLLYGRRPAWRAFQLGITDGADVRQLESNLKALGYGSGLTVDDHFSSATSWAIRSWQLAAGMTVTGSVQLGQIVFAHGAVRITGHDLKLGMPVQPGTLVEHGTSDARAVTAQISPLDFPDPRIGNRAVVTLPDGTNRRGRITKIGTVAASAGSAAPDNPDGASATDPATPVTIRVRGSIRGFLDQAQVQVAVTTHVDKKVLAVPTTALRALPRGRYEVRVVGSGAMRRVRVEPRLFDETAGLAEVATTGLSAGDRVEVPRDGA
jgi:peptidoglycan hydrolase-like protein with peptidoglycan-binding domain